MMDGPMTELRRGSVVGGTITGLRNYGAFLELDGGVSGLLHISQVSYDRIDNLETLFTIGQVTYQSYNHHMIISIQPCNRITYPYPLPLSHDTHSTYSFATLSTHACCLPSPNSHFSLLFTIFCCFFTIILVFSSLLLCCSDAR